MVWLILVASLTLLGCGIFPEKVAIDDARVKPLLVAAAAFNRSQYGFTPLPTSGYVHLESRPRAGYDAMLHISGKTSRTITFRRDKSANGYIWIGEQEIFEGPKDYKSVDGTYKENICLTYEIENLSGASLNRLNITYTGDDPRLADREAITLTDLKPILKEWGY
jgi:hypothetical protein